MDLIDRDKLKEAYLKEHVGEPGRAFGLICEAETVDAVQVRHGHWNILATYKSDDGTISRDICECSECRDTVWVYREKRRRFNYCPNCGAKMDWEESEERK